MQKHAFEKFRDLLCSPPVLKLPDLQWHFIVDTNTCVNTTGAMLLQDYDDGLHPVAFLFVKVQSRQVQLRRWR